MPVNHCRFLRADLRPVPDPDPPQNDDRQKRDRREPGDRGLAERHHDQRRQHRTHRGAETAAELKYGLRKAVAPARSEARDPRRLGMEHSRPKTDQCRRDQDDRVSVGYAQQQQAEEGERHADRKRERLRLLVGEVSHHRLQQRGGELERQRDHADLRKVERIAILQDRIDRRNQRLHRVVEKMRETDSDQHDIGRPRCSLFGKALGSSHARRQVRNQHWFTQCLFGDDGLVQWNVLKDSRDDSEFLRRGRPTDQFVYPIAAMRPRMIRQSVQRFGGKIMRP